MGAGYGAAPGIGDCQESICLRYVDHELIPHEVFVGLYEGSLTTGQNLANVAKDVLLHLNLSLDELRGQTYDGAANIIIIHKHNHWHCPYIVVLTVLIG